MHLSSIFDESTGLSDCDLTAISMKITERLSGSGIHVGHLEGYFGSVSVLFLVDKSTVHHSHDLA